MIAIKYNPQGSYLKYYIFSSKEDINRFVEVRTKLKEVKK